MTAITKLNKAVFLDRDGVVNELIIRGNWFSSPRVLSEFKIFPKAYEAIKLLRSSGFLSIVATNQPDIARGQLSEVDLKLMHEFMIQELGLNAAYFCPHGNDGDCDCRKPEWGMIKRAMQEFYVDPAKSFVVGDRWRDIDMGTNAGCKTILIETEATKMEKRDIKSDFIAANILEAANWIIHN